MSKLEILALQELKRLGQVAMTAHRDYDTWRAAPLSEKEKTALTLSLNAALQGQCEWILALIEWSEAAIQEGH